PNAFRVASTTLPAVFDITSAAHESREELLKAMVRISSRRHSSVASAFPKYTKGTILSGDTTK
ncbi:hypothetical protein, partial [Corynebacterium casei]|uniref:hypothetical protein n=1 Tax=Corynebacterium casei TaxID=160386 RepID=UPI003BB6A8BA